ncbi:MAG: polysaccharide biosynthesis tyrosine autokinase [Alphaproteobacteria bacterium]
MTNDIHPHTPPSGSKETFNAITQTLWRKRVMICAVTLLGVSTTALYIKSTPRTYRSQLQIVFKGQSKIQINTQKEYLLSPALLQSAAHELQPPYRPYIQNLSGHHIPDSYVLALSYTSENPQYTARLLNKVAATYIKNYKPEIKTPIESDQLHQTLNTLREDEKTLQTTLTEIQNYANATPPQKQVTPNKDLEKIKLEYIQIRNHIAPFLNTDGTLKNNLNAPAILNSANIQELKLQKTQKQQKLNELSEKYGHKHPKIIDINSEISLIRHEIMLESKAIMHRLKNKYDTLGTQITALEVQSAQTTATNEISPKISNIIEMLQEKIKANRTLQHKLQNQHKISIQKPTPKPRILKIARVPQKSIAPNAPKIMAIGTSLSLLFALLIVLLNEKIRNTFLSGRQLEEFLNLPCYALIPRIDKNKTKPMADYVMDNPSSNLTESVRTLQLVLKLRHDTQSAENQTISITSSLQNEGKTTLSCWLAQLSAKSGKRVILIDTDLRSPSVHKCFGKNNKLSLVEYLGGHKKLEDIIDTSDTSGLHIIYGRAVPNSALDLISSDKMEQLVRSLRQTYDIVILDTPACMAVSDARALQKLSDQILYAVAWNKTPRRLVHNGITQFSKFGNTRIATVLTHIDLKKHVQFGYGDTINDYGSYNDS